MSLVFAICSSMAAEMTTWFSVMFCMASPIWLTEATLAVLQLRRACDTPPSPVAGPT